MQWFLAALKKYAVFSGRARRKEYWYFVLFYVLLLVALSIMDGSLGSRSGQGMLGTVFTLVMLVPSISVTVRRLHDTNRSGWWVLISLIPLIGGIILIVFAVQDSQPGNNRFGPNPKTKNEALEDDYRWGA